MIDMITYLLPPTCVNIKLIESITEDLLCILSVDILSLGLVCLHLFDHNKDSTIVKCFYNNNGFLFSYILKSIPVMQTEF